MLDDDELWEAFLIDEEAQPEPERGDFWDEEDGEEEP